MKVVSKTFLPGLIVSLFFSSCQKNMKEPPAGAIDAINQSTLEESVSGRNLKDFTQVNLVGDNNDFSPAHQDPSLVNAWGIAFSTNPTAPVWVTSENGGVSDVYTGDGSLFNTVTIPSHSTATGGHPTGVVLNTTGDFKLPNGVPARFIFAEAEGVISGWNGGYAAAKVADDANSPLYFGIAIGNDGGNNFLYVANFSEGKIEVYDKDFQEVNKPFVDPNLPQGFSPANIQNIDGKLYVMYAKPGRGGDEVIYPREGFVDIYNPDGSLVRRFVSQGQLNAPWGITKAPAGFWGDDNNSQDIFLVGNFGDGRINVYNAAGEFQGQLRQHGNPIEIERLWAIAFPPTSSSLFDHNSLYFAAGPGKEHHGLFGLIKK